MTESQPGGAIEAISNNHILELKSGSPPWLKVYFGMLFDFLKKAHVLRLR